MIDWSKVAFTDYKTGWRWLESKKQCLNPHRLRPLERLFNPNRLP
jgi:hypothetical protein